MTRDAVKMSERNRSMAIVLLAMIILMANNGLIIAGLTAFDRAIVNDLGTPSPLSRSASRCR